MIARAIIGDCRVVMQRMIAEGEVYDAIITDPPYHLTSGKKGAVKSSGFMGKAWDGGDVAFQVETWKLAYGVLKPGGYLLAFGGTRTFHRMAVAIEDAGFELRDTLMWLYGTGFPKSHNQGDGWGTALKPAWEPIIMARKPVVGTVAANRAAFGTGAINVAACVVPTTTPRPWREYTGRSGNVYGTGLEGSRAVEDTTLGRWPANVLHDGSEEVEAAFATFKTSQTGKRSERSKQAEVVGTNWLMNNHESREYTDTGTASRFFYCAKASVADRAGSKHPTVKPQALMRWLVTLVTPPGGTILDPFAGSGSTLQAARDCRFHAVGIELEPAYHEDIKRRIEGASTTDVTETSIATDTSSQNTTALPPVAQVGV
jgi:site-specific DNA-methyltransferase (adenine-specific)